MQLWGPRQDILSYVREIWIRVTTSKKNEYRVFVALASVLQLYSSQTLILFGKFDMEQHILINIDRLCFLSPLPAIPSPGIFHQNFRTGYFDSLQIYHILIRAFFFFLY